MIFLYQTGTSFQFIREAQLIEILITTITRKCSIRLFPPTRRLNTQPFPRLCLLQNTIPMIQMLTPQQQIRPTMPTFITIPIYHTGNLPKPFNTRLSMRINPLQAPPPLPHLKIHHHNNHHDHPKHPSPNIHHHPIRQARVHHELAGQRTEGVANLTSQADRRRGASQAVRHEEAAKHTIRAVENVADVAGAVVSGEAEVVGGVAGEAGALGGAGQAAGEQRQAGWAQAADEGVGVVNAGKAFSGLGTCVAAHSIVGAGDAFALISFEERCTVTDWTSRATQNIRKSLIPPSAMPILTSRINRQSLIQIKHLQYCRGICHKASPSIHS